MSHSRQSKMFLDKPMKATDYEDSLLSFPYLASVKLDGYRAFSYDGMIRTSSGTPVLNTYTRNLFSGFGLEGLDGELIVGSWNDKNAFHNTSGPVRKGSGEPDVRWYVFDDRTFPKDPFKARIERARERVEALEHDRVIWLPHRPVRDRDEMFAFEGNAVDEGFEGIMLRDPEGPYKFGRSTVIENWLLKVKRFITEEGTILALEEQMENLNASAPDAFGRARKSIDKNMQVGTGMVGSFVVRSDSWREEFRISASSMSHKDRKHAWENPDEYLLRLARYKYFPHGVVDAPRHGVFESIRGTEDL